MKITVGIQERAEKIQDEAHEYVKIILDSNLIIKNKETIYDDVMNMYLFTKLAETEEKIKKLEALIEKMQ